MPRPNVSHFRRAFNKIFHGRELWMENGDIRWICSCLNSYFQKALGNKSVPILTKVFSLMTHGSSFGSWLANENIQVVFSICRRHLSWEVWPLCWWQNWTYTGTYTSNGKSYIWLLKTTIIQLRNYMSREIWLDISLFENDLGVIGDHKAQKEPRMSHGYKELLMKTWIALIESPDQREC